MKTLIALSTLGTLAAASNHIIGLVTLAVVCFAVILSLGLEAVHEPLRGVETEEE